MTLYFPVYRQILQVFPCPSCPCRPCPLPCPVQHWDFSWSFGRMPPTRVGWKVGTGQSSRALISTCVGSTRLGFDPEQHNTFSVKIVFLFLHPTSTYHMGQDCFTESQHGPHGRNLCGHDHHWKKKTTIRTAFECGHLALDPVHYESLIGSR